jgi:hypothetical protein
MKITKALNITVFSLLCFAIPVAGHCQIYTLSTPISGYMTMSVQDLNGPSGSSGGFQLNFNSLSETIYLDPVGETLRQVGTISFTPSATNLQFQETQTVPGQFPNPPTNVSGTLTVNLAPSGGNVLSFDTGPQAVTWNPSISAYTVDATLWAQGLPMSGSYSLVTGGQTFTGSFSYTLHWWSNGQSVFFAYTFTTFSVTNYPSSIQLSGLGDPPYYPAIFSSPGIVADVKAANGFEMKLSPGVVQQYVDSELFVWSSPSVTAMNVASGAASITNQPQSVVIHAHNTASFSVAASGTVPLSYQWSLNGTNISGATSSSLVISNVAQNDLGAYAVVVTNSFGSATSSNATLSMYPFIATPFMGAVTYWGKPATFSMQAWGTGPLSYQWFKDGVAILNAITQTLTIASIQATNAGLYSVVVTSSLGSATNAPAQVIVYPAGVSLGFCPTVTISGVTGYSYIIQSSPDLRNTNAWVTLTNLTLTQPVELWLDTSVDASSPFNSRYFYRVLPGQ